MTAAAVVFTLAGSTAQAATITVDSTADENASTAANGNCTLREALLAANGDVAVDGCNAGDAGADTIVVPAGTYGLSLGGADEDASETGDLDLTQDVTLSGVGSGSTIVDATGLGDRVMQIAAGTVVRIEGLTVTAGRVVGATGESVSAGGIYNDGDLTLVAAAVTNNEARGGSGSDSVGGGHASAGGIYSSAAASLTLDAVAVSGNRARGGDGGFGCCSLSCSCNFGTAGGSASDGGIRSEGTLSIVGSTIRDNSTIGGGSSGNSPGAAGGATAGGLGLPAGTAEVSDSSIIGNAATAGRGFDGGTAEGAAMRISGASLTVDRVLIAENTAAGVTSTFAGNGGSGLGGGMRVTSGSVEIENTTFHDNLAIGAEGTIFLARTGGDGRGGALSVASGATVSLRNSTLADNSVTAGAATATSTAGEASGGAIDAAAGTTTVGNTIVAASQATVPGVGTTEEGCGGTVTTDGGNLESPADTCAFGGIMDQAAVSAVNLALEPLAANGGPTGTRGLGGSSLAVNGARNAPCPTVDQRSMLRDDGSCDVGAFELDGVQCTDSDGDGFAVEGGVCGPIDCNDGDSAVNPGAAEIPGNGIDDDCDPSTPSGCGSQP